MGVFVMMNNYFHDVATAMLLVASILMMYMIREVERHANIETKRFFVDVYPKMSHIIGGTIVFIFMAGIVRTFTYEEFEWANAVGNEQVPAIIVKHVLVVVFLIVGLRGWFRVHKRVKEMKEEIIQVRIDEANKS
ncbi:MAG: hypothetical protein RQ824_00640 [bacterium]|nr:hypothetical protein [bacterium]